jgi:hypothetical protein
MEAGQTQQGLLGSRSAFYEITRGVTVVVNLSTVLVLGLVKAITDNPPTSFHGNVAVWGPYTDALSSNTYRLTATDNGNHHYSYVLEGKGKLSSDSAYVTVLSGNHLAATDSHGHALRGFGSGSFTIDWDAAQTLPDHDNNVGSATFSYSRLTATSPVEVDVTFRQIWDSISNQRIDANYQYVAVPGGDGLFRFSTYRINGGAIERLAIESRWKNTGAGRADVIVTGGTVGQPATVSECWDATFISQFLQVSYDPTQNYGSESSCAFIPAEFSPL